jgi:ketosteroid isomerase-like protein
MADGDDVRALVTEYVAALSAHDVERVIGCVDVDFVNEHTSSLGTSCTGRETYRSRLPAFLSQFDSLTYEVVDTIVEGERAAVRYRMSAVFHDQAIDVPGVMLFEVRGGVIARRTDVWDSLTFLRQAGLSDTG